MELDIAIPTQILVTVLQYQLLMLAAYQIRRPLQFHFNFDKVQQLPFATDSNAP